MHSSSASASCSPAPAKLCDEGGHLLVGHSSVMAPRQFRWSRQQVIQMTAPPGRVLAVTEALGLGRV